MKKTFLLIIFICALPLFIMAEHSYSPEFMKGYVSSKLENRFPNANIEIDIDGSQMFVCSWPADLKFQEVKDYLEEEFPNYRVHFNVSPQSDYVIESFEIQDSMGIQEPIGEMSGERFGEETLLPELHPFFPTMLAQPHILGYSVGYRSYDEVFKSTIPVSIGDQFSLYQFPLRSCSRLFLGIEACVWAIF